jgi:hypothetical protein
MRLGLTVARAVGEKETKKRHRSAWSSRSKMLAAQSLSTPKWLMYALGGVLKLDGWVEQRSAPHTHSRRLLTAVNNNCCVADMHASILVTSLGGHDHHCYEDGRWRLEAGCVT